jgi:glycosyltransferase involved in cell wall biosynthesis
MKVVLLNNLFGRTAKGGAEAAVLAEARRHMEAGDTVTVLTLSSSGLQQEYVHEGIHVLELPTRHPFAYHHLGSRGLREKFLWHAIEVHGRGTSAAALDAIREERPGLVVTHNLMGFGLALPRLLAGAGIPHEHVCHDVQLLWPSGLLPATAWPWWQRLGVAFRSFVVSRVVGSPTSVRFPSRFLRDAHVTRGFFARSQVRVAPNALAASLSAAHQGARRLAADAPFVFVGQLEPHKGILLLLRAWRGLGKEAPPLRVVGDGAAAAEAKRLAEGLPVTFLGRLGAERFAEIAAARAVIVPSLCIENAPTVIFEAHAAGVPVLAAAAGGIPEFVDAAAGDRLFAPGDEAGLVEGVRSFVK